MRLQAGYLPWYNEERRLTHKRPHAHARTILMAILVYAALSPGRSTATEADESAQKSGTER